MPKTIQIQLEPEKAFDPAAQEQALRKSGIQCSRFEVVKRSIDARGGKVRYQLAITCYAGNEQNSREVYTPLQKNVQAAPVVLIAGAGPAGYFAAMECIALGLRPLILERGKPVRERRRDLAQLTREHRVNPESNYCFGEGGAGTYSDGKLYTRSDKRGDIGKVLDTFCYFGADADIRINARPHIGTNKLPGIIENMRSFILDCGGEILFGTRVTDFIIKNGALCGVKTEQNETFSGIGLILATGHSADDIYYLLRSRNIYIEPKAFALGVRAEHPQELIDSIQYKRALRGEYLPPAYYSLVTQVQGKGVYSFCMCPGGIIAPCSTQEGMVVTNGWSPSKRNNPFANSGIVTEISPDDARGWEEYPGDPLALLHYRARVERDACAAAGNTQSAPAQVMTDFVKGKTSAQLPVCSYTPGIVSTPLQELLPASVSSRLQKGFIDFGKKMHGYLSSEAVLVAPESRTSSPVRIPRDPDTLMHIQTAGLFPCAEGAGYAGGIVSAAIDGYRCARAAAAYAGLLKD